MFKKKSQIPPRPKPPTSDMLREDLQAGEDDNLCSVLMSISREFTTHDEASTFNNSYDKSDPELVFEQVKMFVDVNQNLKDHMKKLQSQIELLLTSNLELKTKAEDIRNQAIAALS